MTFLPGVCGVILGWGGSPQSTYSRVGGLTSLSDGGQLPHPMLPSHGLGSGEARIMFLDSIIKV